MWLFIIIAVACLFGAYLWFGHVRFRQYSRDVVYVADIAMAEAGETLPTRKQFMDSAVFGAFVREGFGTRSGSDTAKAALSYFDEIAERFRVQVKEISAILQGIEDQRFGGLQEATEIFEAPEEQLVSAGFGAERDAISGMISNLRRHYYQFVITYRDDPEMRAQVAQQTLELSAQYGSAIVKLMDDFERRSHPMDDWIWKVVSGINNEAVYLKRKLNA
jgi:trehalose-6-phosphatase